MFNLHPHGAHFSARVSLVFVGRLLPVYASRDWQVWGNFEFYLEGSILLRSFRSYIQLVKRLVDPDMQHGYVRARYEDPELEDCGIAVSL